MRLPLPFIQHLMNKMITSIQNPKVKYVRDLLSQKKQRDQAQAFVVEGIRLAEEALSAQFSPSLVLYSSQISERGRHTLNKLDANHTQIEEVDSQLMDRISDTETSQGLLLVCKKPEFDSGKNREPFLVLDQIRDPGNLGTILRSASAFGFSTIFLTPGSVDPFAPKVLRGGMGAQFKLAIRFLEAGEIRDFCKSVSSEKLEIILAEANSGQSCWESDFSRPLCLIIGSEAFGANPEIGMIADKKVLIPMQANNESLNAAMAASILMYEIYRQRNAK